MRKSTKSLFLDLHDLQQGGVALDTRILVDDGELAIHWPLLQLWGQWWSGLGQAGEDNVVMLPGVSLAEAQEFVDILYDREVVNNEHFTVIDDTGVIAMKMFSTTMIVLISNWSPMRSMTRFPVIIVKKYSTTRKLSFKN